MTDDIIKAKRPGGARHRRKGDNTEREIVNLHRDLGLHAQRVPLSGAGFTMLERWLAEYDALFLRRNHADPLICIPWRVWVRLLERVRK